MTWASVSSTKRSQRLLAGKRCAFVDLKESTMNEKGYTRLKYHLITVRCVALTSCGRADISIGKCLPFLFSTDYMMNLFNSNTPWRQLTRNTTLKQTILTLTE